MEHLSQIISTGFSISTQRLNVTHKLIYAGAVVPIAVLDYLQQITYLRTHIQTPIYEHYTL